MLCFSHRLLITNILNLIFNNQVVLTVWDTSSWNVEKETESKFDAMIIMVYDMSIVKLAKGWEVIWPVMFQINFWNLNTGVERVALKSVSCKTLFRFYCSIVANFNNE